MEDECRECIHGDNCLGTEPGGECQGTYFFKPKNASQKPADAAVPCSDLLAACGFSDGDIKKAMAFSELWGMSIPALLRQGLRLLQRELDGAADVPCKTCGISLENYLALDIEVSVDHG